MIFIDTGPWIARYLSRDQHHDAAVADWARLSEIGEPLFTSSFVLDEAFTLLARRADYRFAAERARSIYASSVLTILRPERDDEIAAPGSFEKLADQRVSFTDCVSFALMRRHKIRRAFTYDRHFASAGFDVWGSG